MEGTALKTHTPLILLAFGLAILLTACYSMPFKAAAFTAPSDSRADFRFDLANVADVGTAYHYRKSNQDGSNAAEEWNYISSATHTESFKLYTFTKLQGRTDLVTADYDSAYFSTSNTNAYLVAPNGTRSLNFATQTSAGLDCMVGARDPKYAVKFGHVPSFNYNFDWCDFAFMYRHLVDKDASFEIGVSSITSDYRLIYAGMARLNYQGRQNYLGHDCRFYTVDGPAFAPNTGRLYVDAASNILVELNMSARNNPTFASFRYSLLDSFGATAQEWDAFILQKTREILKR